MLNTGFSPWPSFSQEEADAVAAVLKSNRVNYWTGREARDFEKEFADWCGTAHAVALHNGTLALEVALRALEIGQGDDVVVTPRSFFASVSTVMNVGARPVFADIGEESQNLTAETIAEALTPATKAVIVVHLAGRPCDMDPIMALAARRGFRVIEDCAQAHGALYKGQPVGGTGDIGAWSFCQDKIMTTGGEGGMVSTNDAELWSRMWAYKDHGKSWHSVYEKKHPPGYRWTHDSIGSNFRMLEMQAAIGRIQLRRMPGWTARRTEIARRLAEACTGFPAAVLPKLPDTMKHAYYRFGFQIDPDACVPGWDRDAVMARLTEKRIPVQVGAAPELYNEAALDGTGYRPDVPLPVARRVGQRSLTMLTHPTLTDAEVDHMASALRATLIEAGV